MSVEENKALVRRYFEIIDRPDANADMLDEFLDPEFITHDPPPGVQPNLEGLKKQFVIFQKSTPGYHTVDDLIAEGDKVAARITGYGTHVRSPFSCSTSEPQMPQRSTRSKPSSRPIFGTGNSRASR